MIKYLRNQLIKDGFGKGYHTKNGIRFNDPDLIINFLLNSFNDCPSFLMNKKVLLEYDLIKENDPYVVMFSDLMEKFNYLFIVKKEGISKVNKDTFCYRTAFPGDRILLLLEYVKDTKNDENKSEQSE